MVEGHFLIRLDLTMVFVDLILRVVMIWRDLELTTQIAELLASLHVPLVDFVISAGQSDKLVLPLAPMQVVLLLLTIFEP